MRRHTRQRETGREREWEREWCVCVCVSLVSKPRDSKNTRYKTQNNNHQGGAGGMNRVRAKERERGGDKQRHRQKERQRERDRSAVKAAFVFCILRSKLRPTWQLEDSSVYNVSPLGSSPPNHLSHPQAQQKWDKTDSGSAKELILWLNERPSATVRQLAEMPEMAKKVGGLNVWQFGPTTLTSGRVVGKGGEREERTVFRNSTAACWAHAKVGRAYR